MSAGPVQPGAEPAEPADPDGPPEPPVRLRIFTLADVPAVMPIERARFGDESWSERMFASELAELETRHYLLAEDAAGVAGYGGLCCYVGEAYVQTLAVAPEREGRGIGTALLTALLAEAVRRGHHTVTLEVRADNPRAQELYRRFGFAEIGLRRGYYQPSGTDAVVMQVADVAGHLAALREAPERGAEPVEEEAEP